jgi:pyruvate kinase
MKMVKTKIVCTIGPSVNTVDKMMQLMQAGMNVARLNFSHGTHAEHLQMIGYLKEVREKLNQPLAIMLDTKGPEIRIGKIANHTLDLHIGQKWLLTREVVEGDKTKVTISPPYILDQLQIGMRILFDN